MPVDFTPGPWILEDSEDQDENKIMLMDEQGVSIASVWKQPHDPAEWPQNNARLFHSAREILDALKELHSAATLYRQSSQRPQGPSNEAINRLSSTLRIANLEILKTKGK